MEVVIKIEEGPQTLVNSLKVAGNHSLPDGPPDPVTELYARASRIAKPTSPAIATP